MEQLAPTAQPLRRIKLKVFGSIDSGISIHFLDSVIHRFEWFRKNNIDR